MVALLDVNVLTALAWPNHDHHQYADDWFVAAAKSGWATCPITESGFVRISANPRALSATASPQDAIAMLRGLREVGTHHFWADDVSIVGSPEFPAAALVGHKQVTDAHLLALARRRGGVLVTFDRRLAALSQNPPAELILIPSK